MPNTFESSKWKIEFHEHDDPIWLIVAVIDPGSAYDEYDLMIGVASAPTKEDALGSLILEDIEGAVYLDAHNLMTLLSRSHMMEDVAGLFDNVSNT